MMMMVMMVVVVKVLVMLAKVLMKVVMTVLLQIFNRNNTSLLYYLLSNAIVASGTGRRQRVVRAHKASLHRQHGTSHVCDGKGNAEWVHFPVTCHKTCTCLTAILI
jgi:hypothetical protein